jgi:hypothetical protein
VLEILNCRTMSRSPSPSTSMSEEDRAAASVPLWPNRTLATFTLAALNDALPRIATSILPFAPGWTLFGKTPGLMSIDADGKAGEQTSSARPILRIVDSTLQPVSLPRLALRRRLPALRSAQRQAG